VPLNRLSNAIKFPDALNLIEDSAVLPFLAEVREDFKHDVLNLGWRDVLACFFFVKLDEMEE
jgi:hypothetical protein